MHNMIQKIQLLLARFKLDQIYNIFIALIIVIILGLSLTATYRSISTQQLKSIYQIAHQSNNAETQDMAVALLAQEHIYVGQYLKLMMALQIEQKKAKQLPPMSAEEN